jgi:hypothetical protein
MKRIEEHLYEHQHTGKDSVTATRYYAKFVSGSPTADHSLEGSRAAG